MRPIVPTKGPGSAQVFTAGPSGHMNGRACGGQAAGLALFAAIAALLCRDRATQGSLLMVVKPKLVSAF